MWRTNTLCTPANEDLGTLAEYDPLTKVRDENVETIQTLVGFADKVRANTLATENLEQVPITRTSLALKITTMMTDMNESADAYQAHNDPVDPGRDDGDEALDDDDE